MNPKAIRTPLDVATNAGHLRVARCLLESRGARGAGHALPLPVLPQVPAGELMERFEWPSCKLLDLLISIDWYVYVYVYSIFIWIPAWFETLWHNMTQSSSKPTCFTITIQLVVQFQFELASRERPKRMGRKHLAQTSLCCLFAFSAFGTPFKSWLRGGICQDLCLTSS